MSGVRPGGCPLLTASRGLSPSWPENLTLVLETSSAQGRFSEASTTVPPKGSVDLSLRNILLGVQPCHFESAGDKATLRMGLFGLHSASEQPEILMFRNQVASELLMKNERIRQHWAFPAQ